MRTGAIFARGSCRALKWMALAGMVFALGAGQAVAQPKPSKPTMLTVEGASGTSVTLKWAHSGGPSIIGFMTQDAADSTAAFTGDNPEPDPVPGGIGARMATVANATARIPHRYRVGAMNAEGTTWSDIRVFTTEAPPTAPGMFEVDAGDKKVTLTWEAGAGDGDDGAVDHYEYNFKPGNANSTFSDAATSADAKRWKRVSGGSVALRVVIPGLTNGKSYAFLVRAVNNGGKVPAKAVMPGIPSGKPGAPTDLTATLGTPTTGADPKVDVTLDWMAPEDDGGNAIDYYEYKIDGGVRDWMPTLSASPGFVITALDADKAGGYTYRVRAVNDNGPGPDIGSDGTTGGPTGPTGPTGSGDGMYGEVTSTKLTGVEQKNIGGVLRNHVDEGSTGVKLEVTVQWLVSELRMIYGDLTKLDDDDADLTVGIVSDSTMTTAWASMVDDQQDVHFPRSPVEAGIIESTVKVKYPAKPAANANPNSTLSATGELLVYILDDNFEAENEVFRIDVLSSNDVDVAARGSRPNTSTMVTVIEDNEVQTVKLSGSKRVMEDAGKAEYTVVADPERYDLPLEVRLDLVSFEDGTVVRGDKYSLSDASPTLNAAGTGGTAANTAKVNLEFPANDGDRMDNAYKLVATAIGYSLASGLDNMFKEQEHPVTLVDVHKLPRLTVSAATDTVKEDGEVTLTLMLDREIREAGFALQKATNEAVEVMLTAGAGTTAGNREYELPAVAVAFPKPAAGDTTQTMTAMVKATMDDVLGEADVLVVDAEVNGTVTANGPNDPDNDVYPGASMLTIVDATTPLVYAKPQAELDAAVEAAKDAAMGADGMFTDGEMIKFMGSALFGAAQGTMVIYWAKSSDVTVATAVVSDDEITVTAMGKGDAMITVEASASTPAGVTINKQTEADRASIEIPVSVALEALAITLKGPDAGMNLVEGMSYTLTANANRAVGMDTMVELVQTDGTAAPADYKVEPITIPAGGSMGTTTLMVEDDGMMENEGNMAEMLTLEGRVGTMKTNSLMFYLWDAAVPALPIIAQLLLAAFLALGGYRRYLRR